MSKLDDPYKESKIWLYSTHIYLGVFLDMYTVSVLNSCTDNVLAWMNTTSNVDFAVAMFNALLSIGQFIGSSIAAPMMDKLGRRKSMVLLDLTYIIGTGILLVPNHYCFAIGRLFTGIAVGGLDAVSSVFSTEVTPEPLMGKIGGFNIIFASLGYGFAFGFALFLPTSDFSNDPLNALWTLLFLFPAAICMYQILFFMFVMKHDSAQFYLSKNMSAEAESAISNIFKPNNTELGLRRANSEIEGKNSEGQTLPLMKMFCAKKFRKMIRVGIIMGLLEVLSGVDTLTFYSTSILTFVGSSLFLSRVVTFVLGIVNIVSGMVSMPLVTYFERKYLLTSGLFLIGLDLLMLSLFSGYILTSQIATIIILSIFYLFFGYSMGTVLWVYLLEVLNDQVFSLCAVSTHIFRTIVVFVFPLVLDSTGVSNTFVFFCVSMFGGAIYSHYDLIKTSNLDKKEILIKMNVIDAQIHNEKIHPEYINLKSFGEKSLSLEIEEPSE